MYGVPRDLNPETKLLMAAGHVRLSRGAESDRERLRHAVEAARERVHSPTERALLAAAEGFLAGAIGLDALAAAEVAHTAAVVPPKRRPAAEAEPSLFPDTPTHAAHVAMAAEAMEER